MAPKSRGGHGAARRLAADKSLAGVRSAETPDQKDQAIAEEDKRQHEENRPDKAAQREVTQDQRLVRCGGIDVAGGAGALGVLVEQPLRIADPLLPQTALVGEVACDVALPVVVVGEDGIETVLFAFFGDTRFDDLAGRRHPVARLKSLQGVTDSQHHHKADGAEDQPEDG